MRPPVFRATFDPSDMVTDNFAGGGGASEGIRQALRSPDIAVNHNPVALAVHKANHPETRHLCQDVWEVDPKEVCRGRRVGFAWFSPDCFPAGTMILTRKGYAPVEEIAVGDEVLTHERRWRAVTAVMSSERPLVRLRGHGHPGLLVSPEHPFYARLRGRQWNNQRRTYEHPLGPAAWQRAGDMEHGWYWASPTEFPASGAPPVPCYRERRFSVTTDLLWLAGRYVADGWTRIDSTHAELVITCGHHETEVLRARLTAWDRGDARAGSDALSWQERDTGTAHQFTAASRGLVEWLREQFGHGAAEKRIPGWLLGAAEDMRAAFLAGYLSGDGCVSEGSGVPLVIATTVSKALAFGIKHLAASLGNTPTVYVRENTGIIEGRKVNARPAWSIRWRAARTVDHAQTVREDGFEWSAIRERQDGVADCATVYNLSVEEDESYVADGIVVHNCTFFSKARGEKPIRDAGRKARSLARRRRRPSPPASSSPPRRSAPARPPGSRRLQPRARSGGTAMGSLGARPAATLKARKVTVYRVAFEYDGERYEEPRAWDEPGEMVAARKTARKTFFSERAAYRWLARRFIFVRRNAFEASKWSRENKSPLCALCDAMPPRHTSDGIEPRQCRYHDGDSFDVLVTRLARWLRWRDRRRAEIETTKETETP